MSRAPPQPVAVAGARVPADPFAMRSPFLLPPEENPAAQPLAAAGSPDALLAGPPQFLEIQGVRYVPAPVDAVQLAAPAAPEPKTTEPFRIKSAAQQPFEDVDTKIRRFKEQHPEHFASGTRNKVADRALAARLAATPADDHDAADGDTSSSGSGSDSDAPKKTRGTKPSMRASAGLSASAALTEKLTSQTDKAIRSITREHRNWF